VQNRAVGNSQGDRPLDDRCVLKYGLMDDCLFCKIVAGGLPSTRVYEDDRVIAIMDIFPATRGHVLVIPRAHARDVHEVSDDDLAAAASAARRLAGMAVSGLGADGVTIMQSNGAAAWQTVFHYHVHVIPRYEGDPLVLPWTPGTSPADPEGLSEISRSYFSD
jgi:histidine triad (HIT) family protein